MDLSSLSIRQLRYLDAVADGQTFSDAADRLFVSQSALSQGLARLEDLVGVPLFESDGRRRRLTDPGRALAASAQLALGEMDRMAADLEARSLGQRGLLRLGMIDAAALYLFPNAIADFRRAHPEVDVRINVKGSDDCLRRLAAFQDDVSIVVGPARGFDTVRVGEEAFHLYGPGQTPSPDATWVLYPSDSHTRALIDEGLRRSGHRASVVGESGNPEVLRQLAILNESWTVLPRTVAGGPGFQRGEAITMREILVARRLTAPHNPVVSAFVSMLV